MLTNTHLNEVFEYLEEQGRLTRANLIGIGIVCGLDIRLDAATAAVHLTRGCGVTSEGYLIIEPEDVLLRAFREYTLPTEVDYMPFKTGNVQYPLWELFPTGTPSTTPLDASFLSDKAVLLFLELKKEGLRNCSPNDCNDKGAEITATVRRLLITVSDLDTIIAVANGLSSTSTTTDIEAALMARLNLPDLRLPRYDVPNTGPVTSQQVWRAFFDVFQQESLAANTGAALTAAYQAFQPILQDDYPAGNPFTDFSGVYGFLDNAPENDAQVRFLQYYYDLFDDLLKAYDEFRAKGMALLCACCPSEALFPRHLMLGALAPAASVNPAIYRHHFITSAAVGNCGQRTVEVVQLFRRLVEMTLRFSHTPPLPTPIAGAKHDTQIRITPSKLGDVAVSEKAIPYYYLQNGTPALYQLWNPAKTRINRANQNLGYRSDEYVPPAPIFITQPLRYDLEPNNFLRIEGHINKHYRPVLETLLLHKRTHRLPIDIIALRTGEYDENAPIDLARVGCRFQDLEALFDSLREQIMHTLTEGIRHLYGILLQGENSAYNEGTAQLPLLQKYAPGLVYGRNTVGAWYEHFLAVMQGKAYIDIDQNAVNSSSLPWTYCILFTGTTPPPAAYHPHVIAIHYLVELSEILPESLDDLRFEDFQNRYEDLVALVRHLRSNAASVFPTQLAAYIPGEDLIDHFDHVLYGVKIAPMRAVLDEYLKRIRELQKKQYLSHFLEEHPGIQHKAGVPIGGTFIVVYHEPPTAPASPTDPTGRPLLDNLDATTLNAVDNSLRQIMANPAFFTEREVANLSLILTANPLIFNDFTARPPSVLPADRAIANAVGQLAPGTVIADFFLPYLCCSDCAPVQFVLAPEQPEQPRELETCEYRWASRDSYLRNLERDYVFSILRYTVNGTNVVAAPYAIEIPTEIIRSRGLQAVADALNALEGLVFGVGTTYSYLSIQRFSDHAFELVIQERGEDDVLSYTQNGVQLNGSTYDYGQKLNCTNTPVTDNPQPCTLPCGGVVQTCQYELDGTKATLIEVVSLTVVPDSGADIEIPQSDVRPILEFPQSLLEIRALFDLVNRIYPAEALAPYALSFTYDGENPNLIAISRYTCYDFRLRLKITYDANESMMEFRSAGIYTGTPGAGWELLAPATNCADENRCP